MKRWLFLLLAPLLPLVQQRVDATAATFRNQDQILYVWSGERLRRMAPGFESVLADVYWLRTVQYFGAQRRFSEEKRFELLLPLITITTDLDPRLEMAYRYGAVFLCERWPTGKGAPEEGVAVLERGVRALPNSWRLRQDLGYFRYIFLNDAAGGARVLLEAAKLPGAPFFLESLAGAILARGGERRTARAVWQRLFDEAEVDFIRDNARANLRRLDALDAVDALEAAAQRWSAQTGRRLASAAELQAARLVPDAYFRDPLGIPLEYDVGSGRFWLNQRSLLWQPRHD